MDSGGLKGLVPWMNKGKKARGYTWLIKKVVIAKLGFEGLKNEV